MHIGQFSLVICSFVLAVTAYFLLPDEPSVFISLIALASAATTFLASYFIKQERLQKYLIRAALVMLVVFIGFAWAQMRSHMQARHGTAPIGEYQINGTVDWHEAQARGSRWDVHVQEGDYLLRLYGKRSHLAMAAPGCRIRLTAEISPLPGPIVLGGYDPRRDAWFAGRRGQGDRPVLHMFGRDLIAARTVDEIVVLRQRGHQYELDRLARHHGVAVREISCRPHCRLTLKGGIEFVYHDRLSGLTQSCRTVDVIVMPFDEARYPCRAQLFASPAFAKRVHRQFTSENGRLLQQRLSNNRIWQRD